MEPHPHADERSDPAGDAYSALGRATDSGKHAQKRRLTCAIVTENADRLTRVDRKVDVTERPTFDLLRPPPRNERLEQHGLLLELPVALAHPVQLDDCGHSKSTKRRS